MICFSSGFVLSDVSCDNLTDTAKTMLLRAQCMINL
jgi:hypothetical protein